MSRMRQLLPLTAAAALLGAAAATAVFVGVDRGGTKTVVRQVTVQSSEPTAASTTPTSVASIYKNTYRGVVEITVTTSTGSGFFGGQQGGTAQGSGFVYDANGHVITNEHVIANSGSIKVKFWDGSTYPATLVGSDASTDVAVLKVDAPASKLHPLTFADSDALQVGDGVVAIGSPFGLEETVTSGIVTALHRQSTAPNHFTID